LVATFNLHRVGVSVVGTIPSGLPRLSVDFLPFDSWRELLPSAFLISIISYIESVSVAKVLANRRRQRVSPNQEMLALGVANLGGAVAGSMPVAGGFSRSMVNYAARARTQLATIVAAGLVAASAIWLTPLFYFMPHAVLGAIIVVAIAPLIDLNTVRETWRYDRGDFAALMTTFGGVLAFNMESGLIAGVLLSLAMFQWRTGRPHVAIVGRVPNTEHYRNVERHSVQTWPSLLLIRIDESLYFANTSYLEDVIAAAVSNTPKLEHVVLICSAVNRVDHSALTTLEQLASGLHEAGITLHLAEVKGPVMDRIRCTRFLDQLKPGEVFLSTEIAVRTLANKS
jgi:SulP family sulfate permease